MPVHRLNRAISVTTVAVAHVAVVALIFILWPTAQRFVEWPESLVVISLPEPAPRPETTKPVTAAQRPARPAASTTPPQSAANESTAPVALPPVDWQQELEGAAKAKADATPWQSVVPKPKAKPKKEFGWSRAHTNRIDRGEPGDLPVLHIGEHCVLIGFLIPACRLGKIPPRGDLFDGMNDPDPPSSVPDAPPSDMRHSDESHD
jgi:hypothetical protein